MADNTVVHIGENSPEQVAYRLFTHISQIENRALYASGDNPADREWVLRTYQQCIRTVRVTANVDAILKG
jgi:hypothetical protein